MSLRYLICFWLLNLTEARRDDGGLRFSFPETRLFSLLYWVYVKKLLLSIVSFSRRGRSTPTIGPTKSIKNAIDTQSNSQEDFLNKIPNEEQVRSLLSLSNLILFKEPFLFKLIFNAFQSLTNPIESGKYNSLIPRKNEQYEKVFLQVFFW